VAFVVCEGIGLSAGSSVDYIHLYDGNKDTLAASLERIQHTSAEILTAIHGDRLIFGLRDVRAQAGRPIDFIPCNGDASGAFYARMNTVPSQLVEGGNI